MARREETVKKTEYLRDGSKPGNLEIISVYKCFCGKGTIEYFCNPGFDDDGFEIKCPECSKKIWYMGNSGHNWRVVYNEEN